MSSLWLYGNMYNGQPMNTLNSALAPPVARGPQSYPARHPLTRHFADHQAHARIVWDRNRPAAMQPPIPRTTAYRDYVNLPRGWGPRW